MTIRTNRLKIDFNIEAIERDFAFIEFKRESKGGWYGGAEQLDRLIGDDYMADAVLFQYGSFAYAMFKRPVDTYDLLSKIRNDKEFSSDAVSEVVPRTYRNEANDCICEAWLAQILINSLASSRSRHRQFHYRNLTGAFIVVPELNGRDWIDAFKVTIDRDYLLNVEVKRYRKLISVRRDVNAGLLDFDKVEKKPKYVFHGSTSVLRRWLPGDGKLDAKSTYIPISVNKKRAHAPFIDFSSCKEYDQSRAGVFHLVLGSIQEHLSEYMSIKLRDMEDPHTIELKGTIVKKPEQLRSRLDGQPIHIVDRVGSEKSRNLVRSLKEAFSSYLTDPKLLTDGKREKKEAFNYRVIHDADYYRINNEKDEHISSSSGTLRQHLTIEGIDTVSNALMKTIIKEQLIKRDVKERNLSLFDWSRLHATGRWTFAAYDKKEKNIVFMCIYPDGHFDFKKIDPNGLPWYWEFDEYVEMLKRAKDNEKYTHLFLEGLVISDKGDKNLIYRTDEISIPDLEGIREVIKEVDARLPGGMRTGNELASVVKQCFAGTAEECDEKVLQLIDHLKSLGSQEISKKDFKTIINSCLRTTSNLAGHLRDTLYKEYGVRVHFSKAKENLNDLFDASLNIKYFEENGSEACYFVGERLDSVQFSFNNAHHFRKITAVNGSKLIFDEILPTMDVDFVRTGQSTVLPFPFKYIREYAKFE